jgi:hypothetical protein
VDLGCLFFRTETTVAIENVGVTTETVIHVVLGFARDVIASEI